LFVAACVFGWAYVLANEDAGDVQSPTLYPGQIDDGGSIDLLPPGTVFVSSNSPNIIFEPQTENRTTRVLDTTCV
jgi:hypothetical protein